MITHRHPSPSTSQCGRSPRNGWKLEHLVLLVPVLAATALQANCVGSRSPSRPSPPSVEHHPKRRPCTQIQWHHATIWADPDGPVLRNASIVQENGVITHLGVAQPNLAIAEHCRIDLQGRWVLPGFWNSHVHFTDPALREASRQQGVIDDMLLGYGFSYVVDTGSDPSLLSQIRRDIRNNELRGPQILSAGGSIVFEGGTPIYLETKLPEVATIAEAKRLAAQALDRGSEFVKIFSGSFMGPGKTIHLPPKIIAGITKVAHERDSLVFAHPTDEVGVRNAVTNGVDVLAHTAPQSGPWPTELVSTMVQNRVALTPTLALWRWELTRAGLAPKIIDAVEQHSLRQLRDFREAGGTVLFGTDVGYLREWDPTSEYALMQASGMSPRDIFKSLSTAPSRLFGKNTELSLGRAATFVVLVDNPQNDPRAFARVWESVIGGSVVYRRDQVSRSSPGQSR